MLWIKRGSTEESDRRYIDDYGEEQCAQELLQYERLTGKDWMDSLIEYGGGREEYGIESFHREVVLIALSAAHVMHKSCTFDQVCLGA